MPVVVARPALKKRWTANGCSIVAVRSKAPIDKLLKILDVSVRRYDTDPQSGPEILAIHSWAIPQGAAISLNDCDWLEDVFAVVDQVASRLESEGIDARIGPLQAAVVPHIHWLTHDGHSASMCLIGEPYWPRPGDGRDWRVIRRMWDTSPEALAALVDLAVEWCQVADGKLYLLAGMSNFEIPRDTAAASMKRIIRTGEKCTLTAANGTKMQRVAEIGINGYATFDISGSEKPGWLECTDELTNLLVSAHHLLNWGFIAHHRSGEGRSGLSARTSLQMHEVIWEPYGDQVKHLSKFMQDPRRHPSLVLDVYGTQLLGPGHDITQISGNWTIRPLTEGRHLVTSKRPASWFAQAPSLPTLLAAREDFARLVDDIWSPTGDLDYGPPPDPPAAV